MKPPLWVPLFTMVKETSVNTPQVESIACFQCEELCFAATAFLAESVKLARRLFENSDRSEDEAG
ncbi:hypothetical protein [Nitrosomonas halophila]|uniref:hypothetical protein n=1 Tax=Nitrosomonas halophila TaxID=44576 RepID=UPI0015A0BCF5|nr:hypothetical protein [Nitrosomonas halophila]